MRTFQSLKAFQESETATAVTDPVVVQAVSEIITNVRNGGDVAVLDYTERFDGVRLANLRVTNEELQQAEASLDSTTRELLLNTIESVKTYHKHQTPNNLMERQPDGSLAGMRFTAIENAGLYIPGGRAGYPSTVIMTVVPAQLASVSRIVLTSPPGPDGAVNPLVLATAHLLQVSEIYAAGGAQAIAGLAYGTESITKVDLIVGPGNMYVNEAKRQVFGQVGIDSLAGPTELVVVADETANCDWVVRDLFAQAEHDPETRVICVTTSFELADKITSRVSDLLPESARRKILTESLSNHGAVICVQDLEEAAKCVNHIAPEHLEVMTVDPEGFLPRIRNAGAIFLGENTPAVVGDYGGGPNHVLPTGRSARFSSPLSVWDFMKFSSVFSFSENALKEHGALMAKFATLENLTNHKEALQCRM